MLITRIYADKQGLSHFEDMHVETLSSGPLGSMSSALPVTSMILRENEPGYDFPWHVAPRRQYIVMLEGMVEITVSDKTIRTFGQGTILLVEDTFGEGHASRSPDGKRRRSLFLPIPD